MTKSDDHTSFYNEQAGYDEEAKWGNRDDSHRRNGSYSERGHENDD